MVSEAGPPPWSVWLAHAQAGSWVTPFWPVLQEAIFDKSTGKVVLKTFSLYRKLLTLSRVGHDQGEAWGMDRTLAALGRTEGGELCDGWARACGL